jgi:hypothetical protein
LKMYQIAPIQNPIQIARTYHGIRCVL